MYKLDLEKAEEPEIKLPTLVGSWKKPRNFRKASTSASLTMLRPLTVWITANCGKFLMRQEYQTTSHVSWENCKQVKKKQLEPGIEQSLVLILEPASLRACTLAVPCVWNVLLIHLSFESRLKHYFLANGPLSFHSQHRQVRQSSDCICWLASKCDSSVDWHILGGRSFVCLHFCNPGTWHSALHMVCVLEIFTEGTSIFLAISLNITLDFPYIL